MPNNATNSTKDDLRAYLRANLFDGCEQGLHTAPTKALLDDITEQVEAWLEERHCGQQVPEIVGEAMRQLCYKPGDDAFTKNIDYCRWCHYAKGHPHGDDCPMKFVESRDATSNGGKE